jgi:hypothetical protein
MQDSAACQCSMSSAFKSVPRAVPPPPFPSRSPSCTHSLFLARSFSLAPSLSTLPQNPIKKTVGSMIDAKLQAAHAMLSCRLHTLQSFHSSVIIPGGDPVDTL